MGFGMNEFLKDIDLTKAPEYLKVSWARVDFRDRRCAAEASKRLAEAQAAGLRCNACVGAHRGAQCAYEQAYIQFISDAEDAFPPFADLPPLLDEALPRGEG